MKLLWKTQLLFLFLICSLISRASEPGLLRDSLPSTWSYESSHAVLLPSEDKWWQTFEDSLLTSLIKRGEDNSFNLLMTLRRMEAARLNWEAARAAYFPTVGLSAGSTFSRQSGVTTPMTIDPEDVRYLSLGLNFSWEIDLFGRVKEKSKAGKANFEATKAQYAAAMVSLGSNIATAYFNYRLAQCRIEVAKVQISSQERISKITEARYETGLASKLDVAQSQMVLYSTQALLPSLINMRIAALNTLAQLVGCYPRDIEDELSAVQDLPSAFQMVQIGVPADLLRRRPDILQAESELAGYAAQLGIAKQSFLPTLSLQGTLGTAARDVKNLFGKRSLQYSVAPQLSWTVFEGMARQKQVAIAREQMLAGIDNYNLTVMNAVIETESALSSYDTSLRQISLYRKVVKESHEAFDLAIDRYKRGLAPFTDVMNAQLSMLDYENTLLQTRAEALTSLVKLYAAVAGGI